MKPTPYFLIPKLFPRRGFALVVTLSLMILLTIVAVGLLSLASVTLRSQSQGQAMAAARNNARMALMLAIGELQSSVGPDRAVTANGEVRSDNPGKPNTVGVWESWDMNPNSSPSYDQEKTSRFQRWLVSSADPDEALSLDFVADGWKGKTVELVGDNSLGGTADRRQKVQAGLVPIERNSKREGAYAWHVSDESQKARINTYRDPSQNSTLAMKRSLLAGHRPDVTLVKNAKNESLDFLPNDYKESDYEEATLTAGKMTSLYQADLFSSNAEIRTFRNDVTPYSLGVLTNVREGGLKKDLSSIFEMTTTTTSVVLPSEFNNKRLYQSTHGITGVSDPYWSALSSYYNTFRGVTTPDSKPTFYQRPTQAVTMSTLAPPTRFYPGPVIQKVEALFSYVTRDAHGTWQDPNSDNDLKKVDPKMFYMGHLIYTPLITLHNPYNINMSFDNLEVSIRNMPVAFNFYINGTAQCSQLVPLNEMFVSDRREKQFVMKIANWSAPGSSSTTGPIVMKPGQTLVCGPYLNPDASFNNDRGTRFFDWENISTGVDKNGSILPINAKPGFAGRCVGFDVDWTTPVHSPYGTGSQSDGNKGVMGLKGTDTVAVEYTVTQPTLGLNTEFQVTAKITSQGRTFDYGGLSFQYKDPATLKKLFNQTYRYPLSGSLLAVAPNGMPGGTYVPNTDPIKQHANAQTFAVFSAYARTTRGGVYETNKRTTTSGAVNALRDGRLAGMPMRFHNPARTVVTMDLQREKLGAHSHELNFQRFVGLGEVEDYFTLDSTNRTPALTGNTSNSGIKSGSYFELPTGPMQTIADFRRSNALTCSYLPNFVQPVSNSLVSPLMGTDKVVQNDAAIATYALLDHSVLANHALYDGFYFSTFSTVNRSNPESLFEGFMDGSMKLPSQGFEPYLPSGQTENSARSELFSSGKPNEDAYRKAAEYQLVKGPFNVNSTNVQAWKAKLASMSNSEIVTLWAKSVGLEQRPSKNYPILPMSLINGGDASGSGGVNIANIDDGHTNEWNGYRDLSEQDLQNLAEKIVEQVKRRGPFLSMSEFVNRRIGSFSDLTRMGALENAIEESGLNNKAFSNQIPITAADISDTNLYNYKSPQATVGNPAAGAPSWLSQGDLLRVLEPAATVRSDTFVVRVCGEAWDTNGNVTARAFAEAVVQRTPEYIDPVDEPSLNVYTEGGASEANKLFGRRMSLVSFRWLASDEI